MTGTDAQPLHPLEQKVLETLRDRGPLDFDSLVTASGLQQDQVRRAISWLSSKELVSSSERVTRTILPLGGLPVEMLLAQRIDDRGRPLEEVRATFKSNQEFAAALGNAKALGWVKMVSKEGSPKLALEDRDKVLRYEEFINSLIGRSTSEDQIPTEYRPYLERLLSRGIIQRKESKLVTLSITSEGIKTLERGRSGSWIEKLTPEVSARIRLTGYHPSLRPIDVEAPASSFHPGRRHPVKEFINEVREVYLSMGFAEIAGDSVQSAFWNFDALFTPQDHPARELQDTFYIKGGRDESVVRKGVVSRVAESHEMGWRTGSKGWRYTWNVEEARRLVLRTHNTVLTIKATMESAGSESRIFSVGRVYRNESLDFKHLAELHQMEGIVIGDGLNLRHLMGILTKFYGKLGMSSVKLWPSYFPYTEPSMQVMAYYDKVGKWLEMGGSGIFRPEVTLPLGVSKPVLAWGCGLERLMMLRLGIKDIRELYDNDLDWLRERRDIASTQNLL